VEGVSVPAFWDSSSPTTGTPTGAVYTVRFPEAVYVLHAFQKKSPSGIRTAKRDVDLLNNASERRSETTRNTMAKRSADSLEITCGSKNEFEDLGDPDAV
jgi:hypothetical protein